MKTDPYSFSQILAAGRSDLLLFICRLTSDHLPFYIRYTWIIKTKEGKCNEQYENHPGDRQRAVKSTPRYDTHHHLEGLYKEYGETLRRSSEDTEQLKDILSAFGFERSDLKTLNFSVDTEYETYKERGEYKQRFVGYKFRHLLKLEFDSDNKRLGKILYALANCPLNPEFRIAYAVKDPEAAKNTLLGKAVKDANEKAEVLAGAAGVTLKNIQSIDYSWGEINFEVSPMRNDMMMDKRMAPMAAMDSYDMDIEPDDIEVSDTVTVVWEIV